MNWQQLTPEQKKEVIKQMTPNDIKHITEFRKIFNSETETIILQSKKD